MDTRVFHTKTDKFWITIDKYRIEIIQNPKTKELNKKQGRF